MSRILIVDDDASTRDSLARLLTAAGHDSVTAANGRDGWLTLYERVPDLILLDLVMPQMDGITFLKLLRRSDHWSGVPVLIVTGFADDKDLVGEARQLGVLNVLPKMSCAPERFLSFVEETLAHAELPVPVRPAPIRPAPVRPAPVQSGCRKTSVAASGGSAQVAPSREARFRPVEC